MPEIGPEVASGDHKRALIALRDRLAGAIDVSQSARDVAALSQRLMDVLEQLAGFPAEASGKPKTPLEAVRDELASRRGRAGSAG